MSALLSRMPELHFLRPLPCFQASRRSCRRFLNSLTLNIPGLQCAPLDVFRSVMRCFDFIAVVRGRLLIYSRIASLTAAPGNLLWQVIPDKRLLHFLALAALPLAVYVPVIYARSLSLAMLPETCEQIRTDIQAAFSVFIVACAMIREMRFLKSGKRDTAFTTPESVPIVNQRTRQRLFFSSTLPVWCCCLYLLFKVQAVRQVRPRPVGLALSLWTIV